MNQSVNNRYGHIFIDKGLAQAVEPLLVEWSELFVANIDQQELVVVTLFVHGQDRWVFTDIRWPDKDQIVTIVDKVKDQQLIALTFADSDLMPLIQAFQVFFGRKAGLSSIGIQALVIAGIDFIS